jgi:hypothetical protein
VLEARNEVQQIVKDGTAPMAIQFRPARAAQSLVNATEIARTANPIVSNQLPP